MEIDYRRQGGITAVPLYSVEDVALLPVVRPPFPLAAFTPIVEGEDRVLLAEVGRAAAATSRRRWAAR
ncbi:hypothetical protein ACFV4Q_24280 [Streptomyces nojiriensis]|uniref:hypothetical protein n=1 Tax=Streptomyces nojiriensis TaxID=66374 RepID=UPI00364FF7F1